MVRPRKGEHTIDCSLQVVAAFAIYDEPGSCTRSASVSLRDLVGASPVSSQRYTMRTQLALSGFLLLRASTQSSFRVEPP